MTNIPITIVHSCNSNNNQFPPTAYDVSHTDTYVYIQTYIYMLHPAIPINPFIPQNHTVKS